MKLETLVNTARLEREQELPEHFETASLKEKSDLLFNNIERLRGEFNVVNGTINRIERAYEYAGKELQDFKKAKNNLEEVIEANKEGLVKREVENKQDLMQDVQLNKAEEVASYKAAGKDLRGSVRELAQKKEWAQESFSKYGELNFKADKRDESVESLNTTLREISGSIELLTGEREDVIEQLAVQAASFLREKINADKLSRVSYSLNGIKDGSPHITELWNNEFADAVSMYGIEAVAKALRRFGESHETFSASQASLEKQKDKIREDKSLYAVSSLYYKMANQEDVASARAHAEKIERERKEALVVLQKIQEAKLKYDGDGLLNIEDEKPNAREGNAVFYKIWWNPRHEYNTLKKSKEEIEKQYHETEMAIQDTKKTKPLLFNKGTWKKKLEGLERDAETLKNDLARLKKGAAEVYEKTAFPEKEKIELPYYPNDKMRDAVNYNMYTHDNYGRGYFGSRSQHPLKTIGDFLNYAEESCKEVIDQKLSPEEELALKRFPNFGKIYEDHSRYADRWKYSAGNLSVGR